MDKVQLQMFMITGISWILSCGLHEAGHAYSATRLGDPTPEAFGRLTLNPFAHLKPVQTAIFLPLILLFFNAGIFLGAASTPINPSYFKRPLLDRVIVAMCGPAVNLLLALAFTGIYFACRGISPAGSFNFAFFVTIVSMNLVLLIFNLLPIPGLDGGDVLRYFLPTSARETFDAARPWGPILAIILMSIPQVSMVIFFPVGLALVFIFY